MPQQMHLKLVCTLALLFAPTNSLVIPSQHVTLTKRLDVNFGIVKAVVRFSDYFAGKGQSIKAVEGGAIKNELGASKWKQNTVNVDTKESFAAQEELRAAQTGEIHQGLDLAKYETAPHGQANGKAVNGFEDPIPSALPESAAISESNKNLKTGVKVAAGVTLLGGIATSIWAMATQLPKEKSGGSNDTYTSSVNASYVNDKGQTCHYYKCY